MSKATPFELSALRASPSGASGERATAIATARRARERHDKVPRHAERDELPAIRAEGSHRRKVAALDETLAGKGLCYHRQSGQRGEHGQDPPPDGLGMDRSLDRRSLRVFT